ncbi:hypothetical protein mRhiFer1_007822 [Rhinolophus ferrumequinum]|uniref:Cancer/testis antigen 1 n=1 Tax=Rhinolophus ferrumequinum TaxID=59479 RepID=A0A7J8AV07_RHIFE|nr:hypothetical protein mRhiFer1_007822 [Rhinolophus ferrumequinum]
MQAADQGPGGAAGGDEGHGTPGDSGGPDGPAGHEGAGRGDEGEAGAAACGAPQAAQALQAPIPGGNTVPAPGEQAASEQSGERSGEAEPTARGPGREQLQYFLRLRFPTPAAADVARRSLAPHGQQQQEAVRMQFRMFGNVLSVRLTAEDPVQLEICVNSCIEQFALSVWVMQRFVPSSYSMSNPGRGA